MSGLGIGGPLVGVVVLLLMVLGMIGSGLREVLLLGGIGLVGS